MAKRAMLAMMLCWTFGTATAHATWREATSAHFIIYSDDASEMKIRRFADRMERFDAALRVVHGIPQAGSDLNKLRIFVVPSVTAIRRLYGRTNTDVAGFYMPRITGSVAFTPADSGPDSSGPLALSASIILFHEYAHHFFYRNYPGSYPAWFSEGYAEFNSTAKIEEDGSVLIGGAANHRAVSLVRQDIPVARMLQFGGYPKDPSEMAGLYAKGWLLLHYLTFNTTRHPQLREYLTLIAQGTPLPAAAAQAFGDLRKLDHELWTYVTQNSLPGWRIAPEKIAIAPITLRTLGAGEAAMMNVHLASTRGVDERTAPVVLRDARGAAAAFPADPAAQAWLAEAETDAGNYEEAEAAETRALAADPRSGYALSYRAQTAAEKALRAKDKTAAAWNKVRTLAVAANRNDPNAAAPLVLYYRSFRAQGLPATKLAVEGLERAYDLAPEVMALRVLLAREYLSSGDVTAARSMLAPIAFDPHGGALAAAVASLVTRIDAGERGRLVEELDKLLEPAAG